MATYYYIRNFYSIFPFHIVSRFPLNDYADELSEFADAITQREVKFDNGINELPDSIQEKSFQQECYRYYCRQCKREMPETYGNHYVSVNEQNG